MTAVTRLVKSMTTKDFNLDEFENPSMLGCSPSALVSFKAVYSPNYFLVFLVPFTHLSLFFFPTALQKHYRALEALALNKEEVEEFEDFGDPHRPDAFPDKIHTRAQAAGQVLYPDGYDVEKAATGKAAKRATAASPRKRKKADASAGADSEDVVSSAGEAKKHKPAADPEQVQELYAANKVGNSKHFLAGLRLFFMRKVALLLSCHSI